MAIRMVSEPGNPVQDYYIHWRSGYPRDGTAIIMMRLADQKATVDPYDWGPHDRTHKVAHDYIYKHFDELEDGSVVDVQFILGETEKPKISERLDYIQGD